MSAVAVSNVAVKFVAAITCIYNIQPLRTPPGMRSTFVFNVYQDDTYTSDITAVLYPHRVTG
ncbi:hypothetical protein PI124_g21215 [Phytophthora idaei]|nr:hypothetical protein PI125_g22467 [Phytophthora idaei]KAG3233716.1 hypothetical protein PI124_g21215 [Phytophthora idaei]